MKLYFYFMLLLGWPKRIYINYKLKKGVKENNSIAKMSQDYKKEFKKRNKISPW